MEYQTPTFLLSHMVRFPLPMTAAETSLRMDRFPLPMTAAGTSLRMARFLLPMTAAETWLRMGQSLRQMMAAATFCLSKIFVIPPGLRRLNLSGAL